MSITIKRFYIFSDGDPSVGIFQSKWTVDGEFDFNSDTEISIFKDLLKKSFEFMADDVYVKTSNEIAIEEMEMNPPYLKIDEIPHIYGSKYNPNYGDSRECQCGHPYYRHFDTYEDMEPVGCKYCECYNFVEKNDIKTGDEVKMSQALKDILTENGSEEHVAEFGQCVGIVEDHVVGPTGDVWPEFNVRWLPSGLRYAYTPDNLIKVKNEK